MIHERKDKALVDYPRSGVTSPCEGAHLGMLDIADVAKLSRTAITALLRKCALPPADGPSIDGRATWSRQRVIVWLGITNNLPDELASELSTVLSTSDGLRLYSALREWESHRKMASRASREAGAGES